MSISLLPFIKMHGLGNDFIIIDKADLTSNVNLSTLSLRLADRHTGIGADQIIIFTKLAHSYEMLIYNQDGSSAEICGNAARCLTSLIHQKFNKNDIILQLLNREIVCSVLADNSVEVDMGIVSFEEAWMPKPEKIWLIAERYGIDPKEITCVDISNPHLIIFTALSKADQAIIGENMQSSELFPGGINVNFATINGKDINLKVWERGSGFTLACGSGACATFAAAKNLGFVKNNAEVIFELGHLKMRQKDSNIIMSGTASFIARGEFYYE